MAGGQQDGLESTLALYHRCCPHVCVHVSMHLSSFAHLCSPSVTERREDLLAAAAGRRAVVRRRRAAQVWRRCWSDRVEPGTRVLTLTTPNDSHVSSSLRPSPATPRKGRGGKLLLLLPVACPAAGGEAPGGGLEVRAPREGSKEGTAAEGGEGRKTRTWSHTCLGAAN